MLNKITQTLTDTQIKALPSSAPTLLPALGSGVRGRFMGASIRTTFFSAYTNVDANASYLRVESAAGDPISVAVANDSSLTTDLTNLTTLLASGDRIVDLPPFAEYVESGGGTGSKGMIAVPFMAAGNALNAAIRLFASNNGAGNFTGGHAQNTMKIITYFVREE